jgi:hypothetical protein
VKLERNNIFIDDEEFLQPPNDIKEVKRLLEKPLKLEELPNAEDFRKFRVALKGTCNKSEVAMSYLHIREQRHYSGSDSHYYRSNTNMSWS